MPPPSSPRAAAAPAVAAPRDTAAHHTGAVALLLNLAHALDHLMLLVFATAVGAIASDFGVARWEDLMPFATGARAMPFVPRSSN